MFFHILLDTQPVLTMFDPGVLLNPLIDILLMHRCTIICSANDLVLVWFWSAFSIDATHTHRIFQIFPDLDLVVLQVA